MKSEDLFQLRSGLVGSGFNEENAEKAVIALESALSTKVDDVMSKWETRFKSDLELVRRDIELVRRDVTIRLGAMIALAVGIIGTLIKLF